MTGNTRAFAQAHATGTSLESDPVAGFFQSERLQEKFYEHCQGQGKPAFMIAGDVINLSQINSIFGRDLANQILRGITAIYSEELFSDDAEQFAGFRSGGDEFNFIVSGAELDAGKIKQAIERAGERVEAFVDEIGIGNLQHKKHENLTGSGLAASFKDINKFSGSLNEIRTSLSYQIDHARQYWPKKRDGQPASSYLTEHALHKCKDALGRFTLPTLKRAVLPEGLNQISVHDDVFSSRASEKQAFEQMSGSSMHSLMRIDLYNLGGLNSYLGHQAVNRHVIEPLRQEIEKNLQAFFPEQRAQVFERGGGQFDIIVPSADPREIADFKKQIQNAVYNRIFGKTIGDFQDHPNHVFSDHEISPDTSLNLLPHKRGGQAGAGLVMTDMPLAGNQGFYEALQRLEANQRVLEYHGASFAEVFEDQLNLYEIGGDGSEPHSFKYKSLDSTFLQVPLSWSLSNDLNGLQIEELFNKPVGLVVEGLTGISLQPVLNRQRLIFSLLDKGIPVEEIRDHSETMADMDAFFAEKTEAKQLNPLDLAGRPSTRPSDHPEFLTLNLARKWEALPPQIESLPDAVLLTQAAVRADKTLSDYTKASYRAGQNDPETLEKLLQEKMAWSKTILDDSDGRSASVKQAQFADHALKLIERQSAILDAGPDRESITAAASLIANAYQDAALDFKNIGLEALAENLMQKGRSYTLGSLKMAPEEAMQTLRRVIDNNQYKLQEATTPSETATRGETLQAPQQSA